MGTIRLERFSHRDAEQIGVFFKFDDNKRIHLKKLEGLTWSKTHSCFYLPYTADNLSSLIEHLESGGFRVERPKEKTSAVPLDVEPLNYESRKTLHLYVKYLNGKRYSENTVRTYYNFILKFLQYIKKDLSCLNNRDIERFVEDVIAAKNYSISSHRQCFSAFKHFGELMQLPELKIGELSKPHKDRKLPVVLSQEEIIQILIATRNLKHRMALGLLYSSGLRVGELLKLKLEDLDLNRNQVFIRNAKGRKDRYVGMAESFKPLLANYLNTYTPKCFLLEGPKGSVYTSNSIRNFLKVSCKRAGIQKRISPHSLRHSYATHMLENGVNLRYIQALLGHSRPETTMIYTQVTQTDILQIKSPLDIAVAKLKNDKEDKKLRLSRNSF